MNDRSAENVLNSKVKDELDKINWKDVTIPSTKLVQEELETKQRKLLHEFFQQVVDQFQTKQQQQQEIEKQFQEKQVHAPLIEEKNENTIVPQEQQQVIQQKTEIEKEKFEKFEQLIDELWNKGTSQQNKNFVPSLLTELFDPQQDHFIVAHVLREFETKGVIPDVQQLQTIMQEQMKKQREQEEEQQQLKKKSATVEKEENIISRYTNQIQEKKSTTPLALQQQHPSSAYATKHMEKFVATPPVKQLEQLLSTTSAEVVVHELDKVKWTKETEMKRLEKKFQQEQLDCFFDFQLLRFRKKQNEKKKPPMIPKQQEQTKKDPWAEVLEQHFTNQ